MSRFQSLNFYCYLTSGLRRWLAQLIIWWGSADLFATFHGVWILRASVFGAHRGTSLLLLSLIWTDYSFEFCLLFVLLWHFLFIKSVLPPRVERKGLSDSYLLKSIVLFQMHFTFQDHGNLFRQSRDPGSLLWPWIDSL